MLSAWVLPRRGASVVYRLAPDDHRSGAALAEVCAVPMPPLAVHVLALDLGLLLSRRLQVVGSTLRPLSKERKAALCRDFSQRALPLFADGRLRPVVDRVLPWTEAAAAHRGLDAAHVGKLVLKVS